MTLAEIEAKLDKDFAARKVAILQQAANKLYVHEILKSSGFPMPDLSDYHLLCLFDYYIRLSVRQVAEARRLLNTTFGDKQLEVHESTQFLVSLPLVAYPGVRLQYVRDPLPSDKCKIHREISSQWHESVVCEI